MQMDDETSNRIFKLLSGSDLDEVCRLVSDLFLDLSQSKFVAIIVWDQDLESFGDRFIYGQTSKSIDQFIQVFCDEYEPGQIMLEEIDDDKFSVAVPKQIRPLNCYQIGNEEGLSACVLFSHNEPNQIVQDLEKYPILTALSRAWEMSDLQKENTRLRDSYEQLEDKTSMLEEQTRKLIHDLTARDRIRTKHVESERLVYSISNVVRSFVDIQKVLETTVESIGKTFAVSRCILLRAINDVSEISVYEFNRANEQVKDLFLTEQGLAFTKTALERSTPQDLGNPDIDDQKIYDREFLRQLGIRSGLIVPLVMRERVLGALFLQDCITPRDWSIDDISLIGSLADQVSVAIENAELHQEKERQAITDGLTGIPNRRSFTATFAREFERAKRYGQSLSLVLIDLDFLKVINDTFGHQVGDLAIKEIGRMLGHSSRAIDLAARYGGEEFCLVLPNTDVGDAEQLAERLRRKIEEVHIEGPGHISASLGVASYPLHANDAESLFRRADEALYEAKQAGRNQVKAAGNDGDGKRPIVQQNADSKTSKIPSMPVIDSDAKSG